MIRYLLSIVLCLLLTVSTHAQSPQSCANNPSNTVAPFNAVQLTTKTEAYSFFPNIAETFKPLIVDYLNMRGSSDLTRALRNTLVTWDNTPYDVVAQVIERDITGDDVPEVLAVVNVTAGNDYNGVIFEFSCQNGQYSGDAINELHGFGNSEDYLHRNAPSIRTIVDLTGDTIPEVIVVRIVNITAPFVDYTFTIFDAKGQALGEIGFTDGAGEIRDVDSDGHYEIVLQSLRYEDSDPFAWSRLDRDQETVWSWDGKAFSAVCTQSTSPAQYRVQAVQDGGYALQCRHYQQAAVFYQQVIDDNTLLGWSEADNRCPGCDPTMDYDQWAAVAYTTQLDGYVIPDTHERVRLTAYARYRLVITYALLDDATAVQAQLDALNTDSTQTDYSRLALVFWNTYMASRDSHSACEQVRAEADDIGSPLDSYSFSGIKYPMPGLKIEPLCPF